MTAQTAGDAMDYRRLGKSGLKVSEFSFGAWVTFGKQYGEDGATSIMATAYDNGINFFDNAEGYEKGNAELVMGAALKALNWPRESYALSSKVYWGTGKGVMDRGLSIKHVTDAAHAALKRFGVDYLDLYFCHRPDLDTPIEETVRAMTNLITQGKVLYWGTSEWTAQQITEAHLVARQYGLIPPTMEQPHYNMFERQKVESDYVPVYQLGLGTTTFSPLASGFLTGKYNDGIPADSRVNLPGYEWLKNNLESEAGKAKIEKVKKLAVLAKEVGLPVHHLALLWCNANPNVSTVILGASRKSQLEDNLKALDSKSKLTPDVMARIEEILGNKPAPPQRY
jgi:voltage-dependent potassium channel beta subunit